MHSDIPAILIERTDSIMLTNENLHKNADNLNEHNNGNKNSDEKNQSMLPTAPTISFQSKTNPKVKVTLEFNDQNSSKNAETELRNIFKNIYLEKIKKGAFQSEPPALGCTPKITKEVEKNG